MAISVRRSIFVLLALLVSTGCGSPPTWEALPLGTKADLRDIWFADAMHGWIAGGGDDITGGLVGRTSDGGKTWRFVSDLTRRERMNVTAIQFFDTARGIAATDSGALLSTSDGGEQWTTLDAQDAPVPCPICLPSKGVDGLPRAVQFLDERNGWVAGMQALLARTTDGGLTWAPVATPIATRDRPNFRDVSFIDAQFGWVVGEEGTMFSTTDGGITWTRRNTGLSRPGLTASAVRFVDRRRGWVTGFYAGLGSSLILRTDDGGATWVIDAEIAGEELRALFIQGHDTAWAIGDRVRPGPQAIYRRALATK